MPSPLTSDRFRRGVQALEATSRKTRTRPLPSRVKMLASGIAFTLASSRKRLLRGWGVADRGLAPYNELGSLTTTQYTDITADTSCTLAVPLALMVGRSQTSPEAAERTLELLGSGRTPARELPIAPGLPASAQPPLRAG